MRIVFWNTNKNENINEYISDIIVEQEIDILVLAEYESDIEELKKMLALYNIVYRTSYNNWMRQNYDPKKKRKYTTGISK